MNVWEYWVWLSALEIRAQAKGALLKAFEDPKRIYNAPTGSLNGFRGISAKEVACIEANRGDTRVKAIRRQCDEAGIELLPLTDSRYPERLRNIYAPPAVLYAKGRMPYLDEEAAVAVIGTRKATKMGRLLGQQFAREIVQCGGLVVSGLTAGVDEAAAEGALQANGICLAVLGTPIGASAQAMAERVEQRGVVLSEYPPEMPCQRSFYRERNRISAGLSVGVVVIEAPEKSGTRLFAREALDQGKDVFAVRGFGTYPGSPGTDALIVEGAIPVTSGMEVIREYAAVYADRVHDPVIAETEEADTKGNCAAADTRTAAREAALADFRSRMEGLPAEALQVIAAVEKDGSYTDELIEATGLSVHAVLVQLTVLEIKGFLRRGVGKRYFLNLSE